MCSGSFIERGLWEDGFLCDWVNTLVKQHRGPPGL